jgi:hypothetical protein
MREIHEEENIIGHEGEHVVNEADKDFKDKAKRNG